MYQVLKNLSLQFWRVPLFKNKTMKLGVQY